MTDVEVVGLSPDGARLLLRFEGRSLEVPLESVRTAERRAARHLSRAVDPTEPLTPRSIQQRIRCGESAEDIAASAGVAVEQVARFEGPPLAEREHEAGLVQRVVHDGRSIEELVTGFLGQDDVAWDAWLVDDRRWEVTATAAGQTVRLRWEAQSRRVSALDDTGRRALLVPVPDDDVLTSVLRPVGRPDGPQVPSSGPRSGRAEVPLWDDIRRQVSGRDEP